jgi:hypothetical protein
MLGKKLLKYPVLIIGIILFGIYVTDPKTADYWRKYNRRFIPSTCDAIESRISDKVDKTWSLDCPGTQLLIIKLPYESKLAEKFPSIRRNMYKLLANSLVKLSQVSNPEAMQNLGHLKMVIEHPRLKILAKTDGEAINQFLKLKYQVDIADHLKLTVKIKEFTQ